MALNKHVDQNESEFYIKKRAILELFDSKYPLAVNLWRGERLPSDGTPFLYPILKSFKLSNGKPRNADIKTYQKNGELWVDSSSGGISLFDLFGVPMKKWNYYKLPAGTEIPYGLVITKDTFNPTFNSTHYSIRPNWDMPLTKFIMLLDILAKNFVQGK